MSSSPSLDKSCLYNVIKSKEVSSSELYNRNNGLADQAKGIR